MFRALNSFRQKLFFKLLLVFMSAGILLLALLFGGIHYINRNIEKPYEQLHKNIAAYTDYLVKDIGTPPQQPNIERISSQTGLEIFIQSEQEIWQSSTLEPTQLKNANYHRMGNLQSLFISHHRRTTVIKRSQDGYEYHFILSHKRFTDDWEILLIYSISIIALVIGAAFAMVRRLLSPITRLRESVQHASKGELNKAIENRSDDELGQLVHAYNDMLISLDKLIQSKEQLLLDVSHELRSPLTRMKVAVELMQETTTRENLQHDINALEQMISLILESARYRNPEIFLDIQNTDIGELIGELVKPLSAQAPGIQIIEPEFHLHLNVDREKLFISLKNIIENAIKYSSHQKKPVEISYRMENNVGIIDVCDFGNGISPNDIDKIFEPFTRLDSSRDHAIPGFGLGLHIAKNIVELHKGNIQVSRDRENRTCFSIFLPQ